MENFAYKELDALLKQDVKKMSYAEYLVWYEKAKELQSHFSLPIVKLDSFQDAYNPN
jgi:hypothetical protein